MLYSTANGFRRNQVGVCGVAITEKDVEYLATLSRLTFNAEESAKYQQELSKIFDYVEELQAVDTSNVVPSSHSLEVSNFFRADEVKSFENIEGIIANGPEVENHSFKVPKILT
jgi:aspartyl-tRNA(Asn)/glutamyl-tRNA(Gln) amidotransferase subunit C